MYPSVPPPRSVYPRAPSYAPPTASWAPPPRFTGPPPPLPHTDAKAIAALVLGLLSFVLGPFTGLAAIAVGALARRDIDRSNGLLEGRGMAASGIVTGIFGMGFVFVVVLSFFDTVLALRQEENPSPTSTVRAEVSEPRP